MSKDELVRILEQVLAHSKRQDYSPGPEQMVSWIIEVIRGEWDKS